MEVEKKVVCTVTIYVDVQWNEDTQIRVEITWLCPFDHTSRAILPKPGIPCLSISASTVDFLRHDCQDTNCHLPPELTSSLLFWWLCPSRALLAVLHPAANVTLWKRASRCSAQASPASSLFISQSLSLSRGYSAGARPQPLSSPCPGNP